MPRIVNYSDRADAVGEKVVALVVREGYDALSRERLATELGWSFSTLRRLITSEHLLPASGVRWIEHVRRFRYFATLRDLGRNRDPWRHWVAMLEAELPLDEDMVIEVTAWRRLTGPGRDMGPAARAAEYTELLGSLCLRLAEVARGGSGEVAEVAARIHTTVAGLLAGAAEGWLTTSMARSIWDRLLADLTPAHPVAPDVNDR